MRRMLAAAAILFASVAIPIAPASAEDGSVPEEIASDESRTHVGTTSLPLHPVVDSAGCRALRESGGDPLADADGPCAPDTDARAVGICDWFAYIWTATPPFPANLVPNSRWAWWESRFYCEVLGDTVLLIDCETVAAFIGIPYLSVDADVGTGSFCWNTGTVPPSVTLRGTLTTASARVGAIGLRDYYAFGPGVMSTNVP